MRPRFKVSRTKMITVGAFWLTTLILCASSLCAQVSNFVYTNDETFPNTVSQFSEDPSGNLSYVASYLTGGSGSGAYYATISIVVLPSGLLYASNNYDGTVSGFSIDSTTGVLTAIAGSPFSGPGSDDMGISLAATPNGKFLVAGLGDSGNMMVFSIAGNGALTALSTVSSGAGSVDGMAISPNGQFLAAALAGVNPAVAILSIGSDGTITLVGDFPETNQSSGGVVTGVDFTCDSSHLYGGEANSTGTIVDAWSIDSSGNLTAVSGSPFMASGAVNSNIVWLSNDNLYLFASDQSAPAVTSFTVNADATLALVAGSPFTGGSGQEFAAGLATDQSGSFLFTAGAPNYVSGYSINSDGTLTLNPTSPFSTGQSGTLLSLAAYPGRSCGPSASTTAVGSTLNPSVYGQSVIFTANVSPASGSGTPTGTVQFFVDSSLFDTETIVSGAATSVSISTLTMGTHTVTTTYSGDSNFTSSTGTLSGGQVVNDAGSNVNVVLTTGTDPSIYGQSLTFTATVNGEYGLVKKRGNGALPQAKVHAQDVTGNVTWSVNTGCSPSVVSGNPGVATCTTTVLGAGANTVTAGYSGDSNHSPGSGSLGQTVNQASQTITFGPLSNQSLGTASSTLSATASSGLAVNFASTTSSVCTVSGATVTLVAVGTCTIQATQAGNANYAAATPVNQNFQVLAADFALSPNPASATVNPGQSGTYALTVTPQGSFTNPISFSCIGLPALAACTFSPATLTPNTNTVTTNLTITTKGPTAALAPAPRGHNSSPLYALCLVLPAMVLGTARMGAPKRRKLMGRFLVLLAIAACLFLAACGGGSNSASAITPAGNYTITVAGIGGSTQHTATVTLAVQ
jgi:6-phosphogluconolactonase (cycloisomerase 2 family)